MTNGIQVRAEAPGSAHSDLGFWLQSQVIGQPMAITERHLTALVEAITANRFVLPRNRATGARITDKGTAIIEMHGILINRAPLLGSFWGLTAYEGLTEQFRRLATNDDVKRIVLDINSPGGLVAGVRACTEALEALAEKKPVFSLAHDMACSAGYWLGCIGQEFSVTPDGEVGSIGVRGGHVSYAEALERQGIQIRNFSVGAAKLDGSWTEVLKPAEAAEYQFDLERSYDRFVAHVAKHRPISEADIRGTDARTWIGQDSVNSKLCDRVETLEALVDRVESSAAKVKPKRKAGTEPGSKGGLAPTPERNAPPATVPGDDEPNAGTPRQARGARLMSEQNNAAGNDTLVAAITEALQANAAKKTTPAPAAEAPAAQDDTARVFAILESEEAKDRPELAMALAKGGMSVEAAKGILKATPVAAAKEEANGDKKDLNNALNREMAKPGNAAGVKPDAAAAAAARPSLAARFEKKFAKAKK